MSARSAVIDDQGPVTLFTRHFIIPAAIIAMVTAFLFYLLEVRSVFLGGGMAFKQVGLCFSAATVLIARYGRAVSADMGQAVSPQGYTLALGGATLLFLMMSSGLAGLLPNLLILAAVWRFATGVTRALSLEELDPPLQSLHLYGVAIEDFRRDALWKTARSVPDAHGNPVASVARLAGLALVGFAIGEPWLLRADPGVVASARTDVIAFLFSTALVLAAGSAAGTLRHTVRAGGRVSPGVLPSRIALAALLSAAVLAAALAIPWVQVRGQGQLRAADRPGETGTGDNQTDGRQSWQSRSALSVEDNRRERTAPPPRPKVSDFGQTNPVSHLVNVLSGQGNLPRLLLALGILVLAFLLLRALAALLLRGRGLLGLLRGLLPERHEPAPDPFADLRALAVLSPRDAILAAYGRLLLALDQAGHPRPDRTTPYEHLNALPPRLLPIGPPVRMLTDLYVVVAYGNGPATEEDRAGVIGALEKVRDLTPPEASPKLDPPLRQAS